MAATVTIEKSYFETLLRRSTVHGYESSYADSTVTLPKDYYDALLVSVREYNALRTALLRGGVTVENLKLLIRTGLENGASDEPSNNNHIVDPTGVSDSGVLLDTHESSALSTNQSSINPPPSTTFSFQTQPGKFSKNNGNGTHYRRDSEDHAGSEITTKQEGNGYGRPYFDKRDGVTANRTLFLKGLPEGATYCSMLEAVRGGAVVDAWMKPNERCGSISFVEPESAEAFYRHAKKNGMYIGGSRVFVEWRESSRQFVVLPNIIRQIHAGATRNLSLRNIPTALTEKILRDDLDHIANLSIEKIILNKPQSSIQINLNSVCVACFARTCLKSRAFYKGVKIGFGPDECADDIPDYRGGYRKEIAAKKPVVGRKVANRFDALALVEDGGEEGWHQDDVASNDDDDDDNADSCWADSVENDGLKKRNGY